jgi:hypothetical protein
MPEPDGDHIWLILLQTEQAELDDSFYLEIPLASIRRLCLTQRMYLLYLSWCILGYDVDAGDLSLAVKDEDGNDIDIDKDGDIEGGVIYHLVIAGNPGKYFSVSDVECTVRFIRHGGC